MRINGWQFWKLWGVGLAMACLSSIAAPATIQNLTGMPTYPNLNKATMDGALRTEPPGRWCARFVGITTDSLDAVEDWYRRALLRASETDLTRDEQFRYPELSGIKLALGRDYVALYRVDNRRTIIELHRCSWN